VTSTARITIHAAVDYQRAAKITRIGNVLFLAYTGIELMPVRPPSPRSTIW
jgi:hypothetical protein